MPASVGSRPIDRVFVVGAGTMGRDIALQCARHGVHVCLYDTSPRVLEQASRQLRSAAERFGPNGGLPDVLARLETCADLSAVTRSDLVIECVPENLPLKQRVFRQISEYAGPQTILATNTSSLIPSQLTGSCRHPGQLVAFHFHYPVATSNIVDLMPHAGTAPEVVSRLDAFARRIGQIPIHYRREHHAYIFNSIFGAMQRQALDLVIDGTASLEDVDRSWMGIFRMSLGPFGMFDQIGLDSLAEVLGHWAETLNDEAGRRRVAFLRRWVDRGFLGAKSGRGFYTYPDPLYSRPGFLG